MIILLYLSVQHNEFVYQATVMKTVDCFFETQNAWQKNTLSSVLSHRWVSGL
jgi:hypothetical protein